MPQANQPSTPRLRSHALALWADTDAPVPRLTLLGPVDARAYGNPRAVAKRKPFYVEMLAYLALHPDGVSSHELADAFGLRSLELGPISASSGHGWAQTLGLANLTCQAPTPHQSAGMARNAERARVVVVYGRVLGVAEDEADVFFLADCTKPGYHVVRNTVPSQAFVAEFCLDDYAVTSADVLSVGADTFQTALNTLNVGKFNLGFAGIGLATHALYETITHASHRVVLGTRVTEFDQVRRGFVDAYVRLVAMRHYTERARDHLRSASSDDRRYLLYNTISKVKVTGEAQRVVAELTEIAAAKGFERDGFLFIARHDVDALPSLEGTVAINVELMMRFLRGYFTPASVPEVSSRLDRSDDTFLFQQGPMRDLGSVRFGDWSRMCSLWSHLDNVALFASQAEALAELVTRVNPSPHLQPDMDLKIAVGELFATIVYGHLILDQLSLTAMQEDVIEELFAVLVRDFSSAAITLHGRAGASPTQREWAIAAVRAPSHDRARFERVWQEVAALSDAYEMPQG